MSMLSGSPSSTLRVSRRRRALRSAAGRTSTFLAVIVSSGCSTWSSPVPHDAAPVPYWRLAYETRDYRGRVVLFRATWLETVEAPTAAGRVVVVGPPDDDVRYPDIPQSRLAFFIDDGVPTGLVSGGAVVDMCARIASDVLPRLADTRAAEVQPPEIPVGTVLSISVDGL